MVSNNPLLLDSNIWIARLNREDSQHAKAMALFESVKERTFPIILPEYVIVEVCTVVTIRSGKEITEVFLKTARDNRLVTILPSTPAFLGNVMDLFSTRKDAHLSFVDVSLLLLSTSCTVVTFDKKLEKEIGKKFP